jgi:UDP-N-acetylmuramoyl-L-alanyl-D-glutamate--2,6-diaminopimelate ligase
MVLVDYAHTPDALERAVRVLRSLVEGRLIVVFGCGGDRDRGKRPLMGEAAALVSDIVILTSDNPRTEDPFKILHDIERGVLEAGLEAIQEVNARRGDASGYLVIPDRRRAIHLAIEIARKGDVVLIAGKGHEPYQIVGAERLPFDDREEARQVLQGTRAS